MEHPKDEKVHSANHWEDADLGSEERNEKFLRLLGGRSDRSHKGGFRIGETSDSSHHASIDTKEVTAQLESQYCSAVDRNATQKNHRGLGGGSCPVTERDHVNPTDKAAMKEKYMRSFVPSRDEEPST